MLNSLSTTDNERLSRLAAVAVCVLAAAVCLWFVLRLLWLLAAPAPTNSATAAAALVAPTTAASSVAKWHLFGNPQSINSAPANPASATVLKLTLFGTLALPDPKDDRAIAIVADAQGGEHSYRLGDDIGSGAKLAEVYADHVILNHEGVAETLTLPRPEQHAPSSLASNRENPLVARRGTAASVPPGYAPAPAAGNPPTGTMPAHIDPQEFARQIRPVFADGKIVGADLSGADATLLSRVGLKPTDIVTAVNGTPLNNVSNPQQLLDSLKNNASIQVTVQRDGKPAILTLSLR